MRFKNIECMHCNLGSSFNVSSRSCRNTVYLAYTEHEEYSFSQALNIRDTNPDGRTEKGLIHVSYTAKAVLQLLKTKVCPPGYIALLVKYVLLLLFLFLVCFFFWGGDFCVFVCCCCFLFCFFVVVVFFVFFFVVVVYFLFKR